MDQGGKTWVKDRRAKGGGYWRKNGKKLAAKALMAALPAAAVVGANLYVNKSRRELDEILNNKPPSAEEVIRSAVKNASRKRSETSSEYDYLEEQMKKEAKGKSSASGEVSPGGYRMRNVTNDSSLRRIDSFF